MDGNGQSCVHGKVDATNWQKNDYFKYFIMC